MTIDTENGTCERKNINKKGEHVNEKNINKKVFLLNNEHFSLKIIITTITENMWYLQNIIAS